MTCVTFLGPARAGPPRYGQEKKHGNEDLEGPVARILGFCLLVSSFMPTREQTSLVGLTVVMITCSIAGAWLQPPAERQAVEPPGLR